MAADKPEVVKKQRDSLTLTQQAFLLLACILAIQVFVQDHVIAEDVTKTVDGKSTVDVNYTGSLYGYYDEGGAMFQTTLSELDRKDMYRYVETYSFNSSVLSVNMADPKTLEGFSSCLKGHKVGDEIRIKIDAKDGYVVSETYTELDYASGRATIALSKTGISQDDFESDDFILKRMGWEGKYFYDFDSSQSTYSVDLTKMVGSEKCTSTKTDFAKIETSDFKITDGKLDFQISITGAKPTDKTYTESGTDYKGVQMFEIIDENWNKVTVFGAQNISDDGIITGKLLTKTTTNYTNNMDLYFVIKIVAIA